ncbi:MAG TPA: tetratricopeptide repeat protein, partial [Gemmatimonas sp.]|nr:tetratricopeptide repeat protein [Gemmatimonas sp.]
MSTPPRIDELRRKFDENPRRYFAPLANEYRKAGDLGQAIGLCREFLPKQPGHMSGHIVFGQALYEAGEMAEARSVFESALALDPENLIALRHLGDIAKTSGDAAGARRWYERVLDADPRNDDIAAQLSTLASGHTPASVPAYGDTMQGGAHSFQPGVSAPGSLTPAYGIGVGMEVLPTPDSSMRAVDFDEVNARISGQTPLFTPAQSSEAAAPAAPAAAADVSAGPAGARFEPLDLDAMDSTYVAAAERSTDAVDERHERSDGMVDADAVPDPQYASDQQPVLVPLEFLDSFDAPDPPNAPDAPDAPAALDVQEAAVGDVRLHHSDDAFAETSAEHRIAGLDDALFGHDDEVGVELSSAYGAGAGGDLSHEQFDDEFDDDFNNDFDNEFDDELLAPEWPEASDIIAQIGTPRSLTPVASPSAEVAPAAPAPAYETHADETVASVTAVHVTPDAM